jgi:glutamate-1-semialdehyde 2,1-aminomutase
MESESLAFSAYRKKTKKSEKMWNEAKSIFVGGQSHNARFYEPYPFFVKRAVGKYVWDVDSNRYVDYWMGHTALILGHSPQVVSSELRKQVGNGLLFGTPNLYAFELGKLVSEIVPCAELVRFCTSGAEATMYATRLARAFTGRKYIAKIAGGWHGYSSSLTVGVSTPYEVSESRGLVPEEERAVKLVPFNNLDGVKKVLSENPNEISAVIVEPVLGAGGTIPADPDYLKGLREECDTVGALLIFDEIITGFRLALGGAQEYYGVKPDICTLGKILGGGLPSSAIVGRADIMSLADTTTRSKNERCWIGGGTFSEHALAMRAGAATLRHLKRNRRSIYRSLAKFGEELRSGIDDAFAKHGLKTQTTGAASLFATHFLKGDQKSLRTPEDVNSSDRKAEHDFEFALATYSDVLFLPGHIGAVSTRHTKSDIEHFIEASESYARKMSST